MPKFRTWLESLVEDTERKAREIWNDTFRALGLDGLPKDDALHQSLSRIVYNRNSHEDDSKSLLKGKRAVMKRLENNQIFARIKSLNIPEAESAVENTKRWLGKVEGSLLANASTTVATLLEKLFGFPLSGDGDTTAFERFVDSDAPTAHIKKTKQPTEEESPEKSQINNLDNTENNLDMSPEIQPEQMPASQQSDIGMLPNEEPPQQ